MRALLCERYGPASALRLADIDAPTPGANDVLIDMRCAALNFPDTLLIEGNYQMKPECPFVPGSEGAGVVAAVGASVSGFTPGQRVIGLPMLGAFAAQACVREDAVIPLPDTMDDTAGAGFVMAYATSYHALTQRGSLKPGDTLLVLGAAGGVGLAAVQIGAALGATVIAAASNAEKLQLASDAGASELIDYRTDDLKARTKALTDGRGVDVVFDPVGGALTEAALRATAWDGRYLVIGFASGTIPKIPFNLPLLKGLHIVGVFWGDWIRREPDAARRNMAELFALHAAGKIRPHVEQVFGLDQYEEAFATLTERRALGKVLFRIDDG